MELHFGRLWACPKVKHFPPRGSEPCETTRATSILVPVNHELCKLLLVMVLVLVRVRCLEGRKWRQSNLHFVFSQRHLDFGPEWYDASVPGTTAVYRFFNMCFVQMVFSSQQLYSHILIAAHIRLRSHTCGGFSKVRYKWRQNHEEPFAFWWKMQFGTNDAQIIWNIIWNKPKNGTKSAVQSRMQHEQPNTGQYQNSPVCLLCSSWPCYPINR